MRGTTDQRHPRSGWAMAARLGQTAWLVGPLYEGLVGMPQLLADARPRRSPGVLTSGSPVRYYVPVAPLAVGATGVTLLQHWRSGGDRLLIAATGTAVASALALSGYLIQTVNRPLLTGAGPLTDVDRHRLVSTWHRVNAVRLVALTVASATSTRLAPPGPRGLHLAPDGEQALAGPHPCSSGSSAERPADPRAARRAPPGDAVGRSAGCGHSPHP
jgi:hypothetical protein